MDQFIRTHLPVEAQPDEGPIAVDAGAPDELRALISSAPARSFARGFWRLVPAAPFRPYLARWNLKPEECVPFLKCAFGHLLFYHRNRYMVLNPVHNCVDPIGDKGDLDFFVMDIALCDRQGLESSFLIDIYEQAFDRLGAPGLDEMYAFVPALRLGGPRDAANVQKRPMRVEMPILAQL